MDFFKLINARHSVRSFTSKPVEEEKLTRILEAANQAPSAGNLQGYEIYIVRQAKRKQMLVEAAYGKEFIAAAPLVLVFCANPSRSAMRYRERGEQLYALQDATIACTFAMLAVTELELATVWVGAFDDNTVREAIGVSQGLLPVAMLPIGYAGEEPKVTARRELQDIIHEI